MQSKRQTIIEVITDMVIGILIAYTITQTIGVYVIGIQLNHSQNITLTLLLTVVSLIRKYLLRRYFNKRHRKKLEERYYECEKI